MAFPLADVLRWHDLGAQRQQPAPDAPVHVHVLVVAVKVGVQVEVANVKQARQRTGGHLEEAIQVGGAQSGDVLLQCLLVLSISLNVGEEEVGEEGSTGGEERGLGGGEDAPLHVHLVHVQVLQGVEKGGRTGEEVANLLRSQRVAEVSAEEGEVLVLEVLAADRREEGRLQGGLTHGGAQFPVG